jgi:hypothetical protein
VVVVGGGEVVGVVVGGGEVVGVVVAGGDVVGVVAAGARGAVVVGELPLLVGEVPVVGGGVGMVVAPDGGVAGLCADFAVTTTDHFPHMSVTFPLTCPADVSPENQ